MIKAVLSLTKRRVAPALVVMVLALSLSATVALAKSITCNSGTFFCAGTHSNDKITGTSGNDIIYGNGGSDTITGLGGDDVIYGDIKINPSHGNDTLAAGPGNDKLYDESSVTNDTYTGLLNSVYDGDHEVVRDSGGSGDVLNLLAFKQSEVFTWSNDSDGDLAPDSLYIEPKGPGNSVLVRDYFDETSGTVCNNGPGTGAIESIKFLDKTVGFPATCI